MARALHCDKLPASRNETGGRDEFEVQMIRVQFSDDEEDADEIDEYDDEVESNEPNVSSGVDLSMTLIVIFSLRCLY